MPRKQRTFHRFKKNDSLAIKALKMAHNIKKLINVEYKKIDTANTISVGTATITNLTLIPQGDDNNERVGNSILHKYVTFKSNLSGNTSNTAIGAVVRMVIFRFARSDGTIPSVGDILETTNNPLSAYARDLTRRDDMEVIRDKLWTVTNSTGSAKSILQYKFNYTFPENKHQKFTGIGSTETSVKSGGVYMLLVSDQTVNSPEFDFYSRITYVDN